MATLTAEQKVERAHVSIMQSKLFRFYSGLTMIGKVSVSDDIPTAGTNGRDVIYGREFVNKMNDKQMLFVVLHELSHIAWRHTTTWKHLYDKDPMLANCACDYVINLQLVDQDPNETEIAFPQNDDGSRMGLLDEKYRGMDAQQVFDLLVKEYGTGQNPRAKDELGDDQFDDHDFEGAEELTPEEKQELGSRVTQALHQGKQLAGKMGGDVPRGMQSLVEPQVPWTELLRDLVKVTCKGTGDSSWRKFSKRHLGADIYLPQNINHKVGRICVADDTSGSIGGVIHDTFMTEIKSICDEVMPEGLDLLYWDTRVAGHEFYTETEYDSLLDTTKPRGGGGTDPSCIPAYMKEHSLNPEITIVLTDGCYGGEGDWSAVANPVIWCVVDNPSYTSNTGKVLHLKT
jgi:predicted metal-dependent peptidase